MSPRQETLWEKFLKPVFQLLINYEELSDLKRSIDWEQESNRLSTKDLIYPHYYLSQNFHGVQGGYLTVEAAVTYDPITQYVLLPNETWIRESVIKAIGGHPRSILDLGCGTGSTTVLLKQAFPQAEIIGLDLSPYMLVMADYKSHKETLNIQWQQADAQNTGLPTAYFDVVTASLLFHETPPLVAQSILKECFRLLIPGGQVVILDGDQKTLRQTPWLTEIFEEPYLKVYAQESIEAWMGAAGFVGVQTEQVWFTNQVTRGLKPLPTNESPFTDTEVVFNPIPAY